MKKYLSLLIGLSCFFISSYARSFSSDTTREYGLLFNAYPAGSGKYTSLFLENNQPYALSDELTIQFDLLIRNEPLLGQIFTARTEADKRIYLTLALGDNGHRFPALVMDEEVYKLASEVKLDEWFPVSVTFRASDNTVCVNYDGQEKKVSYPLGKVNTLQIFFGGCKGIVGEVTPMNLKEVKVWNDGSLFRHWKLNRHTQNICYDELQRVPAVSANTKWLIDRHVEWTHLFSYKVKNLLGTTYDSRSGVFYLIEQNRVLAFDPVKNEKKYYPVKGGYVAMDFLGHFVFDPLRHRILSYSLSGKQISVYSFETGEWSLQTKNTIEPTYANHSKAYCAADSSYYMIGGYGFFRFNNALFKLNPSTGKVEQIDYKPALPPRVSGAAGVIGNTLYVFGGRGNESGRQEVLGHNYYELYAIDLKTRVSRKLWTVAPDKDERMLLSSSMCYVPEDSAFYLAAMSNKGHMMKLSLKDSTYTAISRAIGYNHLYPSIDFNLYQASSRMYAVFHEKQAKNQHEVTISEISLPLMTEDEIMQKPDDGHTGSQSVKGWAAGVGILLLLGIGFCIMKRSKHRKSVSIPDGDMVERKPEKEMSPIDVPLTHSGEQTNVNRGKASISLLGTFGINDKEGNDITASFTPRLKSLLILLILYSQKDKRGIFLKNLDELLWSDKDDEAARNNRNVSMRKLRVLLEEIGDVEIINDNGFIHIELSECILCDYHAAYQLIGAFAYSQGSKDEESFSEMLKLLSYGPLLSNVLYDWLDSFKAAYSTLALDTLNELLDEARRKKDNELAFRIIDIMFQHDPLNEEALTAKCVLLVALDKKRMAKIVYDDFNKAYREFLGEDYKIPFEDLCK